MHKSTLVVYDLLLRQYDGVLTACVLAFLAVYLLAAAITSGARGRAFVAVLIIGTSVLIAAPWVYRLVIRAYVYLQFGY